jgi:hypothetical protein
MVVYEQEDDVSTFHFELKVTVNQRMLDELTTAISKRPAYGLNKRTNIGKKREKREKKGSAECFIQSIRERDATTAWEIDSRSKSLKIMCEIYQERFTRIQTHGESTIESSY